MKGAWGKDMTFDIKDTTDLLGVKITPIETSLEEMTKNLVEIGYIDEKITKKGCCG